MEFEVNSLLEVLSKDLGLINSSLDIERKKSRLEEVSRLLEDPITWDDLGLMASLSKERVALEDVVLNFSRIKGGIEGLRELQGDAEAVELMADEIRKEALGLEAEIKKMKIIAMFRGESDECDSFIEINAGAGGTDSQDWAEMMIRMYSMWADKEGYKFEVMDILAGEEAGVKSAVIRVTGRMAYGWLKGESGVHRLVRISPFNSNAKRQTGFASVFAYPVVNESVNIEVNEGDLRVDTYRSSGAGGQHVNKTESAIRLTHIPSGIVVSCQTQRSQIQNRAEAMRMSKSKLYEAEMRRKLAERDKVNATKMEISFGSQIRNYVLHPYQIVKDLRSNWETGNAQSVLDGGLRELMESILGVGEG